MRCFLDIIKPNIFLLQTFFHQYTGLSDNACKIKAGTTGIYNYLLMEIKNNKLLPFLTVIIYGKKKKKKHKTDIYKSLCPKFQKPVLIKIY